MEDQIFYWLSFLVFLVIFDIGKAKKNLRFALIYGILSAIATIFIKNNIYLQTGIFILLTTIIYYVLKLYEKNNYVGLESFALQGKRGIVIEPVAPFKNGCVKIDGYICPAQSLRNTSIEVGAIVEVIGASNCHIVVEKIHEY